MARKTVLYHGNSRKDSFRLLKPVILLCPHPPDSLPKPDTDGSYTRLSIYQPPTPHLDSSTNSLKMKVWSYRARYAIVLNYFCGIAEKKSRKISIEK